ncbi:polymer-forming cytoskeletal protein [Paeniroseomonas aquatica]|uniref:Polymer-forming cytoskeletal protein n=2 Tax=Paeniroseomonas aquatica TaxID=373043 RepID=A0ABT8A9B2_9PROT|nr:polymer-forming cytoskeletal protein [Paeniroseomonas aquatica]
MAIFGRKRDDGPAAPASDDTVEPTDPAGQGLGQESGQAPGQTPGQAMGTPPTARDADIGVPPFRPTPKDTPMMSMAPKPTAAPATPSLAPRPAAPGAMGVPARPQGRSDAAERRTLVVGRGISLQGTVTDAERLVVEGTVESEMIQAAELFVAPTGVFRGEVQVEDAEIAGLFDGTVTARGSLTIRGTGKVNGTARYRKLAVEEGGQMSGRMEMLTEGSAAPAPRFSPPEG